MENYNCTVLIDREDFYKVKPYLDTDIKVLVKQDFSELINLVRTQQVHCGILYCENQEQFNMEQIDQFSKNYPNIPLISLLKDNCIKTAHILGKVGVKKVLHYSEINDVSKEVKDIIHKYSIKVSLEDIGIIKQDYSAKLNDALHILEKNYIKLMGVKEIAELLEINECTLSREFKKYGLPGPKRILMYLKVHHAMRLMENKGLNKFEIASLSGFSNERRLAECLHKIYQDKPC